MAISPPQELAPTEAPSGTIGINVQGKKGWLRGEADYIAFYFTDLRIFKIFKRNDLLEFVEQITETTENSKEYMKLYKRAKWNQDDVIVKARLSDIEHLKHKNLDPH